MMPSLKSPEYRLSRIRIGTAMKPDDAAFDWRLDAYLSWLWWCAWNAAR